MEQRYLDLVASVSDIVSIPVAVKVSPYFSAMANMAARLAGAGASGLVLFNRFVQPDILLDELEVAPHLVLSTSDELRLALRWIAILRGRVKASLAATGGAHTADDVLKLLLAGADCVMIASSLLRQGPKHIATLVSGIEKWISAREYDSIEQMKGSLSQLACPDPAAFERNNYMKALTSFTGPLICCPEPGIQITGDRNGIDHQQRLHLMRRLSGSLPERGDQRGQSGLRHRSCEMHRVRRRA